MLLCDFRESCCTLVLVYVMMKRCNQATWWSDVIASREYNGIVSIHIMLLTANLPQLVAVATLPGTDDSEQKVPLVAVDCSDQSHCTRCGFSLRGELKRIVFS